jgi:hypothetical protein
VTLEELPNLKRGATALATAAQTNLRWPSMSPLRVISVRSKLAADARAIASELADDDTTLVPLATAFSLGAGEVVPFGVDVDSPPFDRFPFARQALAQRLFHELGRIPRGRAPGLELDLRARLAHALNMSEAPSPLLIVPVVAVYILIVGPINHKLLRRYDAHVLIVATTPVVAMLFTGVIFLIGYVMTGLATVVLRTTLLEARSGDVVATERTAISIHSSTSSTYKVALDDSLVAARVFPQGTSTEKEEQALAIGDKRSTYAAVPLNLWEHAFFVGTALRPIGTGVKVEQKSDSVSVVNGTGLALGRGILFRKRSDKGLAIPPVAPVTTVEVAEKGAETGGAQIQPIPKDVAEYFAEDEDRRKLIERILTELTDRIPLHGRSVYLAALESSPSTIEVDGRSKATRDVPFLVVQLDEEKP